MPALSPVQFVFDAELEDEGCHTDGTAQQCQALRRPTTMSHIKLQNNFLYVLYDCVQRNSAMLKHERDFLKPFPNVVVGSILLRHILTRFLSRYNMTNFNNDIF